MLQGHFIDSLLAIEYRDSSNIIYNIWNYFRGITAPVFFTVSGLIFTYLILKAKEKNKTSQRLKKGLQRGLMLIFVGYTLRTAFFRSMDGVIKKGFLAVDILQTIGMSLIFVVCIYMIFQKKPLLFSIVMFCLGTVIFVLEPSYTLYTAEGLPFYIANYFTKSGGSTFTIFPWFGFMAFGAFIASIFFKYQNTPRFKSILICSFSVIGTVLILYSSLFFNLLYELTNIDLVSKIYKNNYLFIRLGNVLVIFGLFYFVEKYLTHRLIASIGQKTLIIFIIHCIILYGSYTANGLKKIIGKQLDPLEAIAGAICFLVIVTVISIYLSKAHTLLNGYFRKKSPHLKPTIKSLNT